MPESAAEERRRELERRIARLSRAVHAVGEELDRARDAAPARGGGAVGAPEAVEARLETLEAENRRLRETLARALEQARRLRARLALVEDEV